eukprot:TRINITY_DN2362_c0_g2_i1.p2 TRINITY_DN2362_c0_g2~~TRINITY_DN2362_c0_g2_i1.p2  ORF type:complete len:146 (-),score=30.44 TRINITY_DN2362_c0_g2_i1:404-841(-)
MTWNLLHVKCFEVVKCSLKIFLIATCGSQPALQFTFAHLNSIKFVSFLSHEDMEMQEMALKVLGNICYGNDEMIDEVIETNCLARVKEIMMSDSKLSHVACWFMANIAAGNTSHIDELIELGVFEVAYKLIFSTSNSSVLPRITI